MYGLIVQIIKPKNKKPHRRISHPCGFLLRNVRIIRVIDMFNL